MEEGELVDNEYSGRQIGKRPFPDGSEEEESLHIRPPLLPKKHKRHHKKSKSKDEKKKKKHRDRSSEREVDQTNFYKKHVYRMKTDSSVLDNGQGRRKDSTDIRSSRSRYSDETKEQIRQRDHRSEKSYDRRKVSSFVSIPNPSSKRSSSYYPRSGKNRSIDVIQPTSRNSRSNSPLIKRVEVEPFQGRRNPSSSNHSRSKTASEVMTSSKVLSYQRSRKSEVVRSKRLEMEVEIASRESSKHSNMDRLASSGHHHAHFSASDNEEERDMSFERRNHSDEERDEEESSSSSEDDSEDDESSGNSAQPLATGHASSVSSTNSHAIYGVGRSRFDSPLPSSDDESLPTSTQLPFSGDDEDWPEDKSPSPVPEVPALPYYYPALKGCRSVDEFHCLNRIEEGTYGVVFRGVEKKTGKKVALKRLKMEKEKEGFPITSLREVCTLSKANHPNIVNVQEIVVGSSVDKIYIVMEYVEHDLKSLTETMKHPFLVGEVKTLMKQLLSGIHHLHDNWILHRDLKTSNLLLSHRGILKIGDFGLAREYGSPLRPYTPIVVTLWYRCPELLLGQKEYSTAVDMWSVGCILAELVQRKALLPGRGELDQIKLIFKLLGTPDENIWPGYSQLPMVKNSDLPTYPRRNELRKRFSVTQFDETGLDLLNNVLGYVV